MFIRKVKKRNGRTQRLYEYLQLVESMRTEKGPRQRLVLNPGNLQLDPSQYQVFVRRIEDILAGQMSFVEPDKTLEKSTRAAARKIFRKQSEQLNEKQGVSAKVTPGRPALCNVLRTHERITIGYKVKEDDGSIVQKYVRANSRLEPEHLEIYRMLGRLLIVSDSMLAPKQHHLEDSGTLFLR